MALSAKEQTKLNSALEKYNELQDTAIKNGRLGSKQQKDFIKNQEIINKLTERGEAKSSQGYKDISKTLTDIGKKQRLNNITGKDGLGLQKDVFGSLQKQVKNTKALIANGKEFNGLEEKLNDIAGDIVSGAYDLTGIKQTQLELEEEILNATDKNVKKNLEGYKSTLDAEAKRLKVNKGIEGTVSTTDSLMGGMGSTIKGFITNPLTIALAALMQFGATQEAIAGQFGAMGVTDFRQELVRSQTEFTKLGLSAEDANKATSDLANNFGVAFDEADELSASVAKLAKTTGMTVDESTKLVGLFTQTQGLTGEQANNLLLSTRQLAKANNVAPDQVLKDVAANTELFAKFSADGGKNILEAAVQARKLGLGLDTVAKVSDGLLNFQESLNAEITASVMIGRQLNLQKARELALNNDIKGAMEEVVKQVGSEAEFNKLNALERKALADAAGLEVSELQKVVSAQKEQKTLTGEISKLTSGIEIPEETMTAIASLVASFKTAGILLAESIGPALNGIVSLVNMIVTPFHLIGMLGPTLIAIFTGMKIQTMLSAKAAAAEAAGKTVGAFVGNPIMAAVGLGLAAGAVTKIGSMIAGVGDLGIDPNGGPIVASPQMGGVFQGKKGDGLSMGPTFGSGGGGSTNIDTSRIEKGNSEIKGEMSQLRQDMAKYFGLGGTAVSGIGSAVESKLVRNLG